MFEKLSDRITDKLFTTIDHGIDDHGALWYDSEEVKIADLERVEQYITTSSQLDELCGVGFYPNMTAIKLSFKYKMKEVRPVDKGLFHRRVFINPPLDLLKVLYRHIPSDVYDFIIKCRNKYNIKELSFDDATWLMTTVLGSRKLD